MTWITQIGGKYHRSNGKLFSLKQALVGAGVEVRHPRADHFSTLPSGRIVAYDPSGTSFFDIESDYYNSIRRCSFHCVANSFGECPGYLGASASLEIAYAILHGRPIILTDSPVFCARSPSPALALVYRNCRSFFVLPECSTSAIQALLEILSSHRNSYIASIADEIAVMAEIGQVFAAITE